MQFVGGIVCGINFQVNRRSAFGGVIPVDVRRSNRQTFPVEIRTGGKRAAFLREVEIHVVCGENSSIRHVQRSAVFIDSARHVEASAGKIVRARSVKFQRNVHLVGSDVHETARLFLYGILSKDVTIIRSGCRVHIERSAFHIENNIGSVFAQTTDASTVEVNRTIFFEVGGGLTFSSDDKMLTVDVHNRISLHGDGTAGAPRLVPIMTVALRRQLGIPQRECSSPVFREHFAVVTFPPYRERSLSSFPTTFARNGQSSAVHGTEASATTFIRNDNGYRRSAAIDDFDVRHSFRGIVAKNGAFDESYRLRRSLFLAHVSNKENNRPTE